MPTMQLTMNGMLEYYKFAVEVRGLSYVTMLISIYLECFEQCRQLPRMSKLRKSLGDRQIVLIQELESHRPPLLPFMPRIYHY